MVSDLISSVECWVEGCRAGEQGCKRLESWWIPFVFGLISTFALKGLNISAQGNALGNENHPKILLNALKGRNKKWRR